MVINKGEPKEISGKPFISESEGSPPELYLGRVIIELWGEEGQKREEIASPFPNEPGFVWRVDNPSTNDLKEPDRLKLFLAGLEGAIRHIKDVAEYSGEL